MSSILEIKQRRQRNLCSFTIKSGLNVASSLDGVTVTGNIFSTSNPLLAVATGAAGTIETVRGYFENDATGAATTIATIAISSNDSAVFEVFAVAREDGGTESAAFRIFGGVENTGGTAALIGSGTKDRTDDGGASADWDVTVGVSGANMTVSVDSDAETVDWKIKVHLTEL